MSVCFGDFELDQERRQLLRRSRPVPLEPKAFELLSLLVERRPRALSRAQIRDVVWSGVFIAESTLTQAVNGIRQALGDDARRPARTRGTSRSAPERRRNLASAMSRSGGAAGPQWA
jgi:DNA-binding winged helix-turn-helix (wHTH) protein